MRGIPSLRLAVLAGAGLLVSTAGVSAQDHAHHASDPHAIQAFTPREASGTAWLPALTPMPGLHARLGGWDLMLHGNVFLQYLHEAGEEHRSGRQAGSVNWFMGMARRPLAGGRLGVRTMASLEPWTIRGCGYPVLLATGETCDGDTIHDRQHPHDLFMELALDYDRPLAATTRWQVYGGAVGEPALGPVAFPHRPSAMPNPVALIGHHWLDATHITFGVVTGAIYGARWKAEASLFNGRAPDENRLDLDFAPLTSYSARATFMPHDGIVLQVSAGHLDDAEAAHGVGQRSDIDRITAGATYHRRLGEAGLWASTVAWGINREPLHSSGSLVLETAISADGRHTWFGRAEVTGKPAEALHVHEVPATTVFNVGKLQAGYLHYFARRGGLQPGVGGSVSAALLPAPLQARYGGAIVPGFGLFLAFKA